LTERFAQGVDELLWEMEEQPLADLDSIRAVIAAASSGQAAVVDVSAALVVLQAARLDVDRLEFEAFEAGRTAGMTDEAIAAVLELPDSDAARQRHLWLRSRHAQPRAEEAQKRSGRPGEWHAAGRRRRRAGQAANRAADSARRREQLSRAVRRARGSRRKDAARVSGLAEEARILAGDPSERVAFRLLRAAAAHERTANAYAELANADRSTGRQLRRKASEYQKAAAAYRRLADHYRGDDAPQA